MQFIPGVWHSTVLWSFGNRPEKIVRANSFVTSGLFTDTEVALSKRIAGRRSTDLMMEFIVGFVNAILMKCTTENCKLSLECQSEHVRLFTI